MEIPGLQRIINWAHQHPRCRWKRLVAGWGCIGLGILGLVLPIMPGWVFLLAGLVLLAPDVGWINRQLKRLGERFPRLQPLLEQVRGARRAGAAERRGRSC